MTTIQVRRGTAAQWVSAATVLAAGELGLDTTNNILKLGDGSTAWASLSPVLNNTYASRASTSAWRHNDNGVVPGIPFSGRPGMMGSARNDAGMSSRIKHQSLMGGCNLVLVYQNWWTTDDSTPTGAITVKASIEYPSGTYFPVHFAAESTSRAVSIPPGVTVASLPVGIYIPSGSTFYVNTTVVPSSGDYYPMGNAQGLTAIVGQDKATLNSATDYTLIAQPSPSGSDQYAYSATAVCATPTSTPHGRVVGVFGDSYAQGAGDASRVSSGKETGWIAKSFDSTGIGYVLYGANGQHAYEWSSANLTTRMHRLEHAASFTDAIVLYGINDVAGGRTLVQIQTDLTTAWTDLSQRGCRVWAVTPGPETTSTDSWATTANQTAASAGFGPESGPGSVWKQLCDWIRTVPSPLTGVFDLAGTVSTLQGSTYVWKAGHTGDGIHPNSTGHTALVNAGLIVPATHFPAL